MFIYKYCFIDETRCFLNPLDVLGKSEITLKQIAEVKQAFLENGWEGDGEIQLIWIPPFIDRMHREDDYGNFIWHVKQQNDGISFIASSYELSFPNLLKQNKPLLLLSNTKEVNIIHEDVESFKKQIFEIKDNLNKTSILEKEPALLRIIIDGLQNKLVSCFLDFISDCYLRFLIHVLSEGNSDNLKLMSNMTIKIPLKQLGETTELLELEDEASHWLTIQQIIGEINNNFKFLPANEQLKEIIKSVDFNCDDSVINILKQHIFIRNCIQHHGGECAKDISKMLGSESLIISNSQDSSNRTVEKFKMINLKPSELDFFITTLLDFLVKYSSHLDNRMKSRVTFAQEIK